MRGHRSLPQSSNTYTLPVDSEHRELVCVRVSDCVCVCVCACVLFQENVSYCMQVDLCESILRCMAEGKSIFMEATFPQSEHWCMLICTYAMLIYQHK